MKQEIKASFNQATINNYFVNAETGEHSVRGRVL